LPGRLALAYARLSRYGLLVLILLLSFFERALQLWLTPAFQAADQVLALVSAFVLPTAEQWLR
jgi:hypothetical protein